MSVESLKDLLERRWLELAWGFFVIANLFGILAWSDWATVPFHFIWVSLSVLYGFRIWGLRSTLLALVIISALTSVAMTADVIAGHQAVDELTEIPLMGAIFLVMLWHVRRGIATNERLRQVSDRNLELFERQHRFVQDASHVLRTPLTIARGHAELLRRTTSDPDAARDADVIVDELKTLQQISDRLLDLATVEAPELPALVKTSLAPLLEAVCRKWVTTGAPLSLGPTDDAVIMADRRSLSLALDELVDNAMRHAPDKPIRVSARSSGGDVVISVVDGGPGVAPEETNRIFQRFARSDDAVSGAGLGLALVRRIVAHHGGTIRAVSEPGVGGVFEVCLPLAGHAHPWSGNGAPAQPPDGTAMPAERSRSL